ncbi:hypothetical protein GCM10011389_23140 [Pontibacillus salipaludis]|uniref:Uncharacterized protein n=2 Tax=Pontibacillus salipaludis TaxID=1697394 RepID=A0ABQ1Q5G3_9BACI|nr:hypothetical protein GCM10011389_23140 [Pontibacillus salipaludis]
MAILLICILLGCSIGIPFLLFGKIEGGMKNFFRGGFASVANANSFYIQCPTCSGKQKRGNGDPYCATCKKYF